MNDTDPLQLHLKTMQETPFVTEAVFRNGLKIIVNEHRIEPVVAINMFVREGIPDDKENRAGLGSLVSEVIFQRPMEEGAGSYIQNARLLGAIMSGTAEQDYLKLEVQSSSDVWKKAFRILSRALLNSTYDRDIVKNEARRLINEGRRQLENPEIFTHETLYGLMFPSSGMGKWTGISEGDLNRTSVETLAGFHKRMLSPERMLLVVSGDVSAIEVLREAAVQYGEIPAAWGSETGRPSPLPQNSFRYRIVRGDTPAAHILFGFQLPGTKSPDYPALVVFNAILGLGNGSVIRSRLMDRKKLIFRGKAELSAGPVSGYSTFCLTTAPEQIDRSEIALLTEIELLKRTSPQREDMERAWEQLERKYRDRIQTVSERAETLAQFEIESSWKRIDGFIAELREVRPADVKRVAAKYYRLDNCSLVEYLPDGAQTGNRTLASVRNTLEALLDPAADQEQSLREKEVALSIDIPEKKSDYGFSSVRYPVRTASVLRGPEIYIREDHSTPLIHMGLFYPGGIMDEKEGEFGITQLMVRSMLQGTQERDAYRFYRQMEIYGGRLEPAAGQDCFGFYFSIPSKNFSEGFDLLVEALETPAFDPETVEWQKTILRAERSYYKSPGSIVYQAIASRLFQKFSYARILPDDEDNLEGIMQDSLKKWHDRHVHNRKPLVAIVGDTEGTSLAGYFVRHLSGSRFREVDLPEEYVPVLDTKETVEKQWTKFWSVVGLGFQAPPVGDFDLAATRVLQKFLEKDTEEFLKREKGAQDIHISYMPLLRGGSLIAYAVVTPGNESGVLESIGTELAGSISGPYLNRDYRSAVNTAAGEFMIRQQDPVEQIRDIIRYALTGNGIEGYKTYLSKLQLVREEEIRAAAERILNIERAVSLQIYGQETVENPPVR